MHFEPRLWIFTEGVRLRIAGTVLIGLAAVAAGLPVYYFWLAPRARQARGAIAT